jgi:hypothetical protein
MLKYKVVIGENNPTQKGESKNARMRKIPKEKQSR